MRQEDILRKREAEKKKKKQSNENLSDWKERAEATLSFLPNQVVPFKERIKIKQEINNASNKEEFSMAIKELYEAIEKTKGEKEAKRIVAGVFK